MHTRREEYMKSPQQLKQSVAAPPGPRRERARQTGQTILRLIGILSLIAVLVPASVGAAGPLQSVTGAVNSTVNTAQTTVSSVTQPANSAAKSVAPAGGPTTAPVAQTTAATTSSVGQTAGAVTAPVSQSASAVTASGAQTTAGVTASAAQTTAAVTVPVAQTSGAVVAPAAQTAGAITSPLTQTGGAVIAPVSQTATALTAPTAQSAADVAAPVVQTASAVVAPVAQTAAAVTAPVSQTSQTVTTAAAPVVQSAAPVVSSVTQPVTKAAPVRQQATKAPPVSAPPVRAFSNSTQSAPQPPAPPTQPVAPDSPPVVIDSNAPAAAAISASAPPASILPATTAVRIGAIVDETTPAPLNRAESHQYDTPRMTVDAPSPATDAPSDHAAPVRGFAADTVAAPQLACENGRLVDIRTNTVHGGNCQLTNVNGDTAIAPVASDSVMEGQAGLNGLTSGLNIMNDRAAPAKSNSKSASGNPLSRIDFPQTGLARWMREGPGTLATYSVILAMLAIIAGLFLRRQGSSRIPGWIAKLRPMDRIG
jgi:hypothetical protein